MPGATWKESAIAANLLTYSIDSQLAAWTVWTGGQPWAYFLMPRKRMGTTGPWDANRRVGQGLPPV